MQRCEESTPAFRLISALAALRKISPAIQRATYIPLYAKGDVLIYERIEKERIDGDRTDGDDLVLVAVNRASATDVELQSRMGFSPGSYRGLIADTSSEIQATSCAWVRRAQPCTSARSVQSWCADEALPRAVVIGLC